VNKSLLTEECAPLSIVSKKPIKRQGGALNFKGLPQGGGWADFKKNLRASLFLINTYQMNLISAVTIQGRQGIYLKNSMLIKESGRC
jgi:hypothetical protein